MDTNGSFAAWESTPAGQRIQARLSEERTLNAIDHLLARIDTLEKAVEGLTTVLNQGPGMVSMLTDMADEAYRKADSSGVRIDERLQNALAIAEKLTAPEMVERLDAVLKFADQAPGLMSIAADVADEAYRKADASGVRIDERLGVALQLAEKLTAPEMLEKLDGVMQLSNQAPGMVSIVADMADEAYRQADEKGVNLDERLKVALYMAERLTEPSMVQKLDEILDLSERLPGMIAMSIDMFDDRMAQAKEQGYDLKTLYEVSTNANHALTSARNEPTKKIGIFGILGALKDPDRQKGLGFLMNFLKYFGKNI